MSGTKAGGLKTRDKNLAKDPNYYKNMGRKGGQNGKSGGFATNRELARVAGKLGGQRSSRLGQRKCFNCLDVTRDNVNGFCASCQPQDTPELRALLGIDAKGKRIKELWPASKSTTNSTTSTTSTTAKPGSALSQPSPASGSVSEPSSSSRRRFLGSKIRAALRYFA